VLNTYIRFVFICFVHLQISSVQEVCHCHWYLL